MGNRKKVGIIARSLTEGGVKRFVVNILNEFEKQTKSFDFYLIHNILEFKNKFKSIKNIYLPISSKVYFDYFASIKKIKQLDLDTIIYPLNVIPLTHLVLKAKKINIVHDLGYFEKDINAYPFLDTLYMKTFIPISCKISDKIAAISSFTKQDIINRFGIAEEKIVVIHEGVESNFRRIDDAPFLKEVSQKYELHTPFLFYAGSVSPRKNLLRVLQAFNKIKDQIPHHLYITGLKAWKSQEVEKYIADNLKNRVKVLGYVSEEELIALYNLAEVYLFPSLYEGFGLPILEAQACGCPVLTSNATSCPEIAGKGALIVNPKSVLEINEGVNRLINEPLLRANMIEKGYKNLGRFSWADSSLKLLKILN